MNHPQFILGCLMVFWPVMVLLVINDRNQRSTEMVLVLSGIFTLGLTCIAYGLLLAIRAL